MKKKKLLTLDDLYSFYVNKGENITYSSKDDDSIVVQVYEDMESDYDSTFGLLKTHLKSCHILRNRNNSYISRESMEEAIPSFYNKPILGYIHQLSDGTYDFAGHELYINEDGECEYEEIPLGVIPESCNAQLVYDEEKDKTYLELDGYIYEEYSRAADILREKKESKVSVELAVDEMSYSAKNKVLHIDKFHFNGVTILGKDVETERPIEEGMLGSNITVEDFSAANNSMFIQQEAKLENILKELEQIQEKISNLSPQQKGGYDSVKLSELLAKYNKTVEDLNFEYESLNDEELEAKFEEVFGEEKPAADPMVKRCSITAYGKEHIFEVSLNDKLYALERLVNDTYSDQDNAYYCVKAYEGYVVMVDYWTGAAYKQAYASENDLYSLTGEREEVFANYLTRAEETALDAMRSNYAALEKEVNEYKVNETASKKDGILNDESYDSIRDTESFKDLIEKSADYSVEEVQGKCDEMLRNFMRENSKMFSAGGGRSRKRSVSTNAPKENEFKPYGTLFDGIE